MTEKVCPLIAGISPRNFEKIWRRPAWTRNSLLARGTPYRFDARADRWGIDRGPMESHGQRPVDRRVYRMDARARVAGPTNRATLCYSLQRAWRTFAWAEAAVLVISRRGDSLKHFATSCINAPTRRLPVLRSRASR